MARITVEDCMRKVSDKFELVALAAQRAKALSSGARITIEKGDDKFPVIALREIALEHVKIDELREALIKRLQSRSKVNAIEEENLNVEADDVEFDYLVDDPDVYLNSELPEFDDTQEFDDDMDEDKESRE